MPLPVLTEEEEAAALPRAEYEDDTGIERGPETYKILRAQKSGGALGRMAMVQSATRFGERIGPACI